MQINGDQSVKRGVNDGLQKIALRLSELLGQSLRREDKRGTFEVGD